MSFPKSNMTYQDIIDYLESKNIKDNDVLYNAGSLLASYAYNVNTSNLDFSLSKGSNVTKPINILTPIAYQSFKEFKEVYKQLDYYQQQAELFIFTPSNEPNQESFEPVTYSIINQWLINTEDYLMVQINKPVSPLNLFSGEMTVFVPGSYYQQLSHESKLRYLNKLINVTDYLDITDDQVIPLDTFIINQGVC